MNRLIVATILMIGAGGAAGAPLTFEQALRRALQVNNDIERSHADIGVARANRQILVSAVLPRIAADGALTRNSIEQTFGEGSDVITILPRNDWNYNLTLSQPVFAGRRELRAYSQAVIGIENAQRIETATQDATLLRVASSYLALVNAIARMDIERRNIELAQKRREQARAFHEAGEATTVDVLRAETAVKAAQRVLAGAEQAREIAESDLRQALEIEDSIEPVTAAPTVPSPSDESSLITRAVTTRSDVMVAQNNVRIARLEVSKQRGYWLPTVAFDGGWRSQKSPFPANQYAYGALRFNVPIFQSGEVTGRVAGARERELQAQLELQNAQLTAREDVRKAMVALRAAEIGLSLAGEQLAAAEAEYAQAFELYRAQEATSLDVATSEASLADARRAVAEETLNRDLAELRVWYAAGAIKEALNVNGANR